jgi:hypothetical protein
MSPEWIHLLRSLAGLIAGGVIGVGFGMVQDAAWRRNQRLQQTGDLKSGWAVMPGSMRRVAYLLVALLVVQIFCPLLFTDGVQWWVSGGVLAGYGTMLFRQFWLRR